MNPLQSEVNNRNKTLVSQIQNWISTKYLALNRIVYYSKGVPSADTIPALGTTGKLDNTFLNTGTGNGLDADTLDTYEAVAFARLAAANTFTDTQTVPKLNIDDTSHYIDTDAASALQLKSIRTTIADNATLTLGYDIKFLFIVDATNGNGALFMLRGGANATQELLDPSAVFSATKDTASSFNVYYESSNYYIQNKRGASKNLTLFTLVG
jgi:hypothetical protein